MVKKVSEANSRANIFEVMKWSLVFVLFAFGFWANYHYVQVDWALRLVGWIVLCCLMLGVILQTVFGRKAWMFAKEARLELRKVFWPTRQETMQTTALVVVMVILTSLMLWGVDSLLLWVVTWLTGRG